MILSTEVFPKTAKQSKEFIPQGNFIISSEISKNLFNDLTHCKAKGEVEVLDTKTSAGCASYLQLRCKNCSYSKYFWSVGDRTIGKLQMSDDKANAKRNDIVYSSVLGGRLIGCGYSKLILYHSILNIPPPMSSSIFVTSQSSVMIAAEAVANTCMDRARDELQELKGLCPTDRIPAIASFDGCYQQRTNSGGGFSRYCFASTILDETSKVVSYGVACNGCPKCTEYNNKLRRNEISFEKYENWKSNHVSICPVEFAHLASVHLESAIAPQVVQDALERRIVFKCIVSDGDNKTHETLL